MIGVLSKDNETRAVEEFFQLFKTPWEFWDPCKQYDVVIATREEIPQDINSSALVIYQSSVIELDDRLGLMTTSQRGPSRVSWGVVNFQSMEVWQCLARWIAHC